MSVILRCCLDSPGDGSMVGELNHCGRQLALVRIAENLQQLDLGDGHRRHRRTAATAARVAQFPAARSLSSGVGWSIPHHAAWPWWPMNITHPSPAARAVMPGASTGISTATFASPASACRCRTHHRVPVIGVPGGHVWNFYCIVAGAGSVSLAKIHKDNVIMSQKPLPIMHELRLPCNCGVVRPVTWQIIPDDGWTPRHADVCSATIDARVILRGASAQCRCVHTSTSWWHLGGSFACYQHREDNATATICQAHASLYHRTNHVCTNAEVPSSGQCTHVCRARPAPASCRISSLLATVQGGPGHQ